MDRTTLMSLVGFCVFLGSCFGLFGCSGTGEEGPGKQPPTVTVSYPLEREVTDYQVYTGRTAAVDSVQVQARVTGYLEKIHFTEGAQVRADDRLGGAARLVGLLAAPQGSLLAAAELRPGQLQAADLLYEIDPRPYQAARDAAKAQVGENVANLALAKQNNTRFKKLNKDQPGAVTQVDLDKYQSQEDQAVAARDQSRANLVTAEGYNLEWTKVTAPVTGLIGRLLVTKGNLIVANQTTLTTIVAQDPMWVYFDMDEPTALTIRELVRQGKFGSSHDERTGVEVAKIRLHLQLANEKGFPHEATLDFVNNQLDQATATILLRGIFPNPKPSTGPRVFTPNMFVRVRVPTSAPARALLVNAEAVGTDQHLKYVYVVDEHGQVARHDVKLGSPHGSLQVIAAGLKPGERVIISGIQRVQLGATVKARLVPMPIRSEDFLPSTPPAVLNAPAPSPKK